MVHLSELKLGELPHGCLFCGLWGWFFQLPPTVAGGAFSRGTSLSEAWLQRKWTLVWLDHKRSGGHASSKVPASSSFFVSRFHEGVTESSRRDLCIELSLKSCLQAALTNAVGRALCKYTHEMYKKCTEYVQQMYRCGSAHTHRVSQPRG